MFQSVPESCVNLVTKHQILFVLPVMNKTVYGDLHFSLFTYVQLGIYVTAI